MNNTALSKTTRTFFEEYPDIAKHLTEQRKKGNFDAAFTPLIVEIKFSGLTYIRYENGEITAIRPCSEGYSPPFWEVCFNEKETALFVLGADQVLLDRTGDMARLDSLLNQCSFLDNTTLRTSINTNA
ncbi:MAG: hypothetical protein AB8B99_17605 [Phormidesmis sp.]